MSCTIYGQEKVAYHLSYTDKCPAIQYVDWYIEDYDLDGNDVSVTHTNKSPDDVIYHVYHSPGDRIVRAVIYFDDGWGNIYQKTVQITVHPTPYDPPVIDFVWDPEEPTVTDYVHFAQQIDDSRDEDSAYGKVEYVNFDIYDDGTVDELDTDNDHIPDKTNLSKTDEFWYNFTEKHDVNVRQIVYYNDGWQTQVVDKVKTIHMSNVPPVADFDVEESGYCCPRYKFDARNLSSDHYSYDIDGDDNLLEYKWELYRWIGDHYELIDQQDRSSNPVYEYQFQYEGQYKIVLTVWDQDNASSTKAWEFEIVFGPCEGGGQPSVELRPLPFTRCDQTHPPRTHLRSIPSSRI